MTGKNRRHYHCKALNSLLCADVPLRNYSLTHLSVSLYILYLSLSVHLYLITVVVTNKRMYI